MATAQQAEDRAAIKRAFAEHESMRKDVAEMKESLRAAEERRLTSVISEQAKEIRLPDKRPDSRSESYIRY